MWQNCCLFALLKEKMFNMKSNSVKIQNIFISNLNSLKLDNNSISIYSVRRPDVITTSIFLSVSKIYIYLVFAIAVFSIQIWYRNSRVENRIFSAFFLNTVKEISKIDKATNKWSMSECKSNLVLGVFSWSVSWCLYLFVWTDLLLVKMH